jgi:hypothetical protein
MVAYKAMQKSLSDLYNNISVFETFSGDKLQFFDNNLIKNPELMSVVSNDAVSRESIQQFIERTNSNLKLGDKPLNKGGSPITIGIKNIGKLAADPKTKSWIMPHEFDISKDGGAKYFPLLLNASVQDISEKFVDRAKAEMKNAGPIKTSLVDYAGELLVRAAGGKQLKLPYFSNYTKYSGPLWDAINNEFSDKDKVTDLFLPNTLAADATNNIFKNLDISNQRLFSRSGPIDISNNSDVSLTDVPPNRLSELIDLYREDVPNDAKIADAVARLQRAKLKFTHGRDLGSLVKSDAMIGENDIFARFSDLNETTVPISEFIIEAAKKYAENTKNEAKKASGAVADKKFNKEGLGEKPREFLNALKAVTFGSLQLFGRKGIPGLPQSWFYGFGGGQAYALLKNNRVNLPQAKNISSYLASVLGVGGGNSQSISGYLSGLAARSTNLRAFDYFEDLRTLVTGAYLAYQKFSQSDTNDLVQLLKNATDPFGNMNLGKDQVENVFRSLGSRTKFDEAASQELGGDYKNILGPQLQGSKIRTVTESGQLVNVDAANVPYRNYSDLMALALNPYNEYASKNIRSGIFDKLTRDISSAVNPYGGPLFSRATKTFLLSNLMTLKNWYAGDGKWLGQDYLYDKNANPDQKDRSDKFKDSLKFGNNLWVQANMAHRNLGGATKFGGDLPHEEWFMNRINAGNFATGGMVYAQGGTLVNFTPRGTDTVPAMLTPGEFVVNRAATQRNLPLLKQINSNTYMADGGLLNKPKVVQGVTLDPKDTISPKLDNLQNISSNNALNINKLIFNDEKQNSALNTINNNIKNIDNTLNRLPKDINGSLNDLRSRSITNAEFLEATINGIERSMGLQPTFHSFLSDGGVVYASKGTLVPYSPKGTDTVPAMLTPGEFVVNASAAKDNMSLLTSINSGYHAEGGLINPMYFVGGTPRGVPKVRGPAVKIPEVVKHLFDHYRNNNLINKDMTLDNFGTEYRKLSPDVQTMVERYILEAKSGTKPGQRGRLFQFVKQADWQAKGGMIDASPANNIKDIATKLTEFGIYSTDNDALSAINQHLARSGLGETQIRALSQQDLKAKISEFVEKQLLQQIEEHKTAKLQEQKRLEDIIDNLQNGRSVNPKTQIPRGLVQLDNLLRGIKYGTIDFGGLKKLPNENDLTPKSYGLLRRKTQSPKEQLDEMRSQQQYQREKLVEKLIKEHRVPLEREIKSKQTDLDQFLANESIFDKEIIRLQSVLSGVKKSFLSTGLSGPKPPPVPQAPRSPDQDRIDFLTKREREINRAIDQELKFTPDFPGPREALEKRRQQLLDNMDLDYKIYQESQLPANKSIIDRRKQDFSISDRGVTLRATQASLSELMAEISGIDATKLKALSANATLLGRGANSSAWGLTDNLAFLTSSNAKDLSFLGSKQNLSIALRESTPVTEFESQFGGVLASVKEDDIILGSIMARISGALRSRKDPVSAIDVLGKLLKYDNSVFYKLFRDQYDLASKGYGHGLSDSKMENMVFTDSRIVPIDIGRQGADPIAYFPTGKPFVPEREVADAGGTPDYTKVILSPEWRREMIRSLTGGALSGSPNGAGIQDILETNPRLFLERLEGFQFLPSENDPRANNYDSLGLTARTIYARMLKQIEAKIIAGHEQIIKEANSGDLKPTKFNTGGIVYASSGKLIDFKPKGTDTVPAMLTPGEFVVNRAATSKNLDLLKSINSGGYSLGGIVSYLKDGSQEPVGQSGLDIYKPVIAKRELKSTTVQDVNDALLYLEELTANGGILDLNDIKYLRDNVTTGFQGNLSQGPEATSARDRAYDIMLQSLTNDWEKTSGPIAKRSIDELIKNGRQQDVLMSEDGRLAREDASQMPRSQAYFRNIDQKGAGLKAYSQELIALEDMVNSSYELPGVWRIPDELIKQNEKKQQELYDLHLDKQFADAPGAALGIALLKSIAPSLAAAGVLSAPVTGGMGIPASILLGVISSQATAWLQESILNGINSQANDRFNMTMDKNRLASLVGSSLGSMGGTAAVLGKQSFSVLGARSIKDHLFGRLTAAGYGAGFDAGLQQIYSGGSGAIDWDSLIISAITSGAQPGMENPQTGILTEALKSQLGESGTTIATKMRLFQSASQNYGNKALATSEFQDIISMLNESNSLIETRIPAQPLSDAVGAKGPVVDEIGLKRRLYNTLRSMLGSASPQTITGVFNKVGKQLRLDDKLGSELTIEGLRKSLGDRVSASGAPRTLADIAKFIGITDKNDLSKILAPQLELLLDPSLLRDAGALGYWQSATNTMGLLSDNYPSMLSMIIKTLRNPFGPQDDAYLGIAPATEGSTIWHEFGHQIFTALGDDSSRLFQEKMKNNMPTIVDYMRTNPSMFRGYGEADVAAGSFFLLRDLAETRNTNIKDAMTPYANLFQTMSDISLSAEQKAVVDQYTKDFLISASNPDLPLPLETYLDIPGLPSRMTTHDVFRDPKTDKYVLDKNSELYSRIIAMRETIHSLNTAKETNYDPESLENIENIILGNIFTGSSGEQQQLNNFSMMSKDNFDKITGWGREEFITQLLERVDSIDQRGLTILTELLEASFSNYPKLFNADSFYERTSALLNQRGNQYRTISEKRPEEPVLNKYKGGMIYASTGKLVNFEPRGTDTIPAMLTPGEFVVNARSTAKHLPLLKAINSNNTVPTDSYSNGGIVYLQAGGDPGQNDPNAAAKARAEAREKERSKNFRDAKGRDGIIRKVYRGSNARIQEQKKAAQRDETGTLWVFIDPNSFLGKTRKEIKEGNLKPEIINERIGDTKLRLLEKNLLSYTRAPLYTLDLSTIYSLRAPSAGKAVKEINRRAPKLAPPIKKAISATDALSLSKRELDTQTPAFRMVSELAYQMTNMPEEFTEEAYNPAVDIDSIVELFETEISEWENDEARKNQNGQLWSTKYGKIVNRVNDIKAKTTNAKQALALITTPDRMGVKHADVDFKTFRVFGNRTAGRILIDQISRQRKELDSGNTILDKLKNNPNPFISKTINDPAFVQGAGVLPSSSLARVKVSNFTGAPGGDVIETEKLVRGGLVYADKGMLIPYQPKGTDTVPAMLTPGEFVINRAATQRNLPLLKAINSNTYATGGVVYAAKGLNPRQQEYYDARQTRKEEYERMQAERRRAYENRNSVNRFRDSQGNLLDQQTRRNVLMGGNQQQNIGQSRNNTNNVDQNMGQFSNNLQTINQLLQTFGSSINTFNNVISQINRQITGSVESGGVSNTRGASPNLDGMGGFVAKFEEFITQLNGLNLPPVISLQVAPITLNITGGEALKQALEGPLGAQLRTEIAAAFDRLNNATEGAIRV